MRNYEFLIKQGPRFDRVLGWLITGFLVLCAGIALGYAWAVKAYGIQLLN